LPRKNESWANAVVVVSSVASVINRRLSFITAPW
jgi:hypothetical protein